MTSRKKPGVAFWATVGLVATATPASLFEISASPD